MENDNSTFDTDIIPLRTRIDQIDSQILSLLAQRQEQVEEVVRLKKRHEIPVHHPAREEDLISKLRSQAAKTKIDPDFMEDLYRLILSHSRVKQTRQIEQKSIRENACVLILGGSGQMGRFFSTLFSKSGYEVRHLNSKDWDNARQLCKGVDLAIISVPIDKTPQIIDRIAPFLDPQTILTDLTSIKAIPLEKMLQAHPGPVLGLHPIFGPTSGSLEKQIIVATPGRHTEHCQWVIDQLTLWGAVMVESTPKEHDDIMEFVQSLRHFATFCFGQFLFEKNIHLKRSLEFSSPIYRLELGMVGRLFAQDSSLYSEIIFATKERVALLKDYIHSMNRHLEMLENNDKQVFIEKFNQIAEWFGPFSEQAMRESTFLINKLTERF